MSTLKHEEQLHKLFTNVNDWLKFAEAKNFGLLSLNAAIVFGFTQTNFSSDSIISTAGFYAFSPFAILSFLAALISMFPVLSQIEKGKYLKRLIKFLSNLFSKDVSFENIYFYGYLKDVDIIVFEAEFLDKINSLDPFSKFEKDLANQILYNSRLTWLKFQLFKIGGYIFSWGVVAFLIALAILKIKS